MRYLFEVGFKIVPMNLNHTLHWLEASWRKYLEESGHHIYKTPSRQDVLRSRNSQKVRYRWLLLVGHSLERTLSKSELYDIRQNLRQAKAQKEATYLVVGFVKEPSRILVLPADAALEAGHIRSDKGGIAWKD